MLDPRPERLIADRFATPLGELLLVTDEAGRLRALDFADYEERMLRLLQRHYGPQALSLSPGAAPAQLRAALQAYFDGDLAALAAVRCATAGTAFQRRVWRALVTIAPGETRSYAGLAAQLGQPTAVRAVGLANGSNPIAIVVPCHRVIGGNGTLTGYAGGLPRKQWLLAHEGARFTRMAGLDRDPNVRASA